MADNTQITTEPKKVEQPVEQPAPDGVELSANDVRKSGVDVPQAVEAPAVPTTTFAPLSKRELRQKEREARRANRKAQREQEQTEQTEDGNEEEKPEEDKNDDKIALSDYSAVGDASGDNGGSGTKTGGGGNSTFTTEQTTDDSGGGNGGGSTPASQPVVRATTTPTSTDTSTKVVKGASQEQKVAIDPNTVGVGQINSVKPTV